MACVYSRSLTPHGNTRRIGHKKHKHNPDFIWDDTVKRKEHKTISDECCPSVTELFQPLGGVASNGKIMELFRDQNSTQNFYTTSCAEGVKGRPCKYIQRDRRIHSVCVQRYSYTYALVRDFNTNMPWRMDYIRIRSGCSCEIKARGSDEFKHKRRYSSEEDI